MLAWIGARTALWQGELAPAAILRGGLVVKAGELGARSLAAAPVQNEAARLGSPSLAGPDILPHHNREWSPASAGHAPPLQAALNPSKAGAPSLMPASPRGASAAPYLAGKRTAAQRALPVVAASIGTAISNAAAAAAPVAAGERRWSVDAWALVRSGSGAGSAGLALPTYGGTQAGAVVRYRLVPGVPQRPTAYVRATAALNGSGEREAALGVSARPIAAVPVVVAAEGRVSRLSGRTVLRPAVMAITEIPPIDLPAGTRAELYLQGGYVGGDGATAFVDGQLRVDHPVARLGAVELRAGAGAWGGAQQDAGRLDVGPSATLAVSRGPAAARLSLDWRFRVAGNAAPASGPALAVSAGF